MTDRDLFIAALDKTDPAERAAFLDRACAGDADLRRRVDILLRAHDQASRFLAAPAVEQLQLDSAEPDDPTRTAHPADETAPAASVDVRALLAPADKPGLLGKLDHFEILDVVGRGGMGVVLKAFDPKLHRLVAIKLMAPHLAASGAARKRFEREARAVAAIRNEHVVAIYGVNAESPTPYLVMEFVGGVSLQDRLEQHGPLDVKAILRIGMQAARGLAAAHQEGIVHRDVKPANILLENGVERVKITDFGLARAVDDANLTQSGVITGTPNYMSPEQASGTTVDRRSDLFSLGSVLYALCTGHPPFRAETPLAVLRRVADDPIRPPREVNPDIPDWLDAIVRKLLAKNPADRFQTATEVAELLGQHLAHLQQPMAVPMPAAAIIPGSGERVWRQIFEAVDHDRRLWQRGMMLGGLLLLGLTAAIAIPGGILHPIWLAPAVVGLGLIAVGAFERQQWDVPYKGRTIRFENSPFLGGRLFVDGVRIARGRPNRLPELRGTIPAGPGAGDEVRALCESGLFTFKCQISVTGGGPAPAPPPEAAASPGTPVSDPGGQLPAALRWPTVNVVLAGFVFLFGLPIVFFQIFFRPEYADPASKLFTAGLLLAVLWWCWQQSEPRWYRLVLALAMVVVIGATGAGLLASWGEGSYLEKLGGASSWHDGGLVVATALLLISALVRAVRWMVARPAVAPEAARPVTAIPTQHGPTAFALGVGFLVLIVGFVVSLFVRELVTPEGGQARTLAFLMGIWSAGALMAFGPGVFVARQWWRKRLPSERRGDSRAAILAGLGIGATIMSNVLTVVRTPALRAELFGPPALAQASLGMNWNRDLIARVTLERDGAIVEEFEGKVKGVAGHYPPGRYTVRGFKDDREVYREEFTLEPGGSGGTNLLEAPMSPAYATLRVDCQDPTVTIDVQNRKHRFQFGRPGSETVVTQGLQVGQPYFFTIARDKIVIHQEGVALKAGERRDIVVPRIVFNRKTVELKPKGGSFPTDVTRIESAPDHSAVAVGRLDGPILVLDASTGRERFLIERRRSDCTAFGFTPDGKHLAFLNPEFGVQPVLRTVDARDGSLVGKSGIFPSVGMFFNAHALAFSPDGKRLAVSSAYSQPESSFMRSRLHRFEWPSGKSLSATKELQDGTIEALRFTPDGEEVLAVSGTKDSVGWKWDAEANAKHLGFHTEEYVHELVAVSRGGAYIAGWSETSGQACIRNWLPPVLGEPPTSDPPLSPVRFGSLAVSPDGRTIAAGTKGGRADMPWEKRAAILLWDAKTGKEKAVLLGHTDWPLDLVFSPDGKELMSVGKDGTVRFWTLPPG